MANEAPELERVVGRYMMRDEIAAGGMATVHIGRLLGPVGFARTVAIKRLHAHLAKDPEFVTMLLDEARLAARIRHPNVVSTLDIVVDKGELWVVMDYVEGESLSRLATATFRRGERMPLGVVASVIAGALYGLHSAHEATSDQGAPLCVIHRDISPQNIMVGVDGVARVLDFGVARAAGRLQTTREGTLKGKLAYMSPEQVRGDPLDRRSDIYSMAVVLWEMVTGKRMFSAENDAELLNKVLSQKAAPPSSVVPSLSAELDTLVMKGLHLDREERFTSALEMAEGLQKIAFATPGEVGAWVTAVSGAAIAERTGRIAKIESQSSGGGAGVDRAGSALSGSSREPEVGRPRMASATLIAQVARDAQQPALPAQALTPGDSSALSADPPARPPPLSRSLPLGLGLAVVGATLFVSAIVITTLPARSREADPSLTRAAPASSSSAVEPGWQPVVVSSVPASLPQTAPPLAPASLPSPSVRAEHPPPRRVPPSTHPNRCNPPYTVDENGIRSPKPECL